MPQARRDSPWLTIWMGYQPDPFTSTIWPCRPESGEGGMRQPAVPPADVVAISRSSCVLQPLAISCDAVSSRLDGIGTVTNRTLAGAMPSATIVYSAPSLTGTALGQS